MTLNELANTLPNGFHDAEVKSIRIDYAKHEALFDINVWIGDLSSNVQEVREEYRGGELVLTGLKYCVIEPPQSNYPYEEATNLTVDTNSVATLASVPSIGLPSDLSAQVFTNWFFVQEWNAFIYVSALEAHLSWSQP